MHVVTVLFEVKPDRISDFLAAIVGQAQISLHAEPDCPQFDVCVDPADPGRIFLYEIYTTAEAFALHLETEHFKTFDARVAGWTLAKTIARFERLGDD